MSWQTASATAAQRQMPPETVNDVHESSELSQMAEKSNYRRRVLEQREAESQRQLGMICHGQSRKVQCQICKSERQSGACTEAPAHRAAGRESGRAGILKAGTEQIVSMLDMLSFADFYAVCVPALWPF